MKVYKTGAVIVFIFTLMVMSNVHAQEQKGMKDREKYLAVLRATGMDKSVILSVARGGFGDDEVQITVSNRWHYSIYQVRLQIAQTLWKAWALIRSPSDPDKARIVIVDINGNKVGGSRWLAGSMIWVQKE